MRPKTAAEREFCALGPVAEAFITGAAAAGSTRLGPELAELNTLRAAHGDEQFLAALDRSGADPATLDRFVQGLAAAAPNAAEFVVPSSELINGDWKSLRERCSRLAESRRSGQP